MITIKDVAKEAGVGVGTVSRYINGDSSIKNKNRMLIEYAIKKLGYEVNSIARSMKTQKTMTIGVVVHSLTNMFSMKVIEDIVSKFGYSILIAGCGGNEEVQYKKLTELKKKMIDGFILLPLGQNAQRVKDIVGDTSCILVDRLLDENIFDSVTVDNEVMVYEKMCEIIKFGLKRIGIIEGPDNISNAVERKRGFYKALLKYGLECAVSVKEDYSVNGGFEGMKKILDTDADAVFVSNNDQVVGALKAMNISEKNIFIVGFDGIDMPWLLDIPCSFIPQPIEEIGKNAAKLLLERISNQDMKIKNIVIRE